MKKTGKEILEDLCHNTMGNPPYRIAQALASLAELVSEEDLAEVIVATSILIYREEAKYIAHAIHTKFKEAMGGGE